jgi:hypothetical protein
MSESDYESEYEQETAPRVTVTTVEKKKQTSQAKLDQLKKARLAKVAKREERLKNPPKHAKRAQAKPEPEAPPSESETETVYVKKQKAPKIVPRKKKRTGRKPHQHAEYDDEPQAYEQHQPYEHHQQQERPPNRKPNGDMIW